MENYVWLFIFAGATIIVEGICLLASERELRKRRREIDMLRRNQQSSETELMTRNKELVETISSLSAQLEENKRTVERELVSAGELNQQLQASQEAMKALEAEQQRLSGVNFENQQLREEIANLQNQLQTSESLVKTTASQYKEAVDRNLQLESDLTESRQQIDKLTLKNNEQLETINSLSSQLTARERTVEELQILRDRLPGIQSENQHLQTANQALREELANVKAQLGTTESRFTEAVTQAREITEHSLKLQTEVSELTQHLQASQETIKALEAEQQRLGGVHLENQQLREEIAALRNQLQTSETRFCESARQNQEAAEHCARLQNEIAELKQQAEEGQVRTRELEAVQEQLSNVESREMTLREQQHKLEAQIAALQRELDTGKEKVRDLDVTHKQLAEMEHICQKQREENRRLEEEISRWQERLEGSEETQKQVSILRQQLEELQAKQAAVAEANSLNDGNGEKRSNPSDLSADDLAARVHGANDEEIKPPVGIPETKKRRFGIIPATGTIAIVAAVAVAFLNTSSSTPSGSKEPVGSEIVSIEQSSPIEAAFKGSRPASEDNESSQQVRRRVQGTFKITRPTQVYSGPSVNSRLIANIERGMKINVVDSRDGWLEIRSKHGRPSGFVRQAAAVRIDQN